MLKCPMDVLAQFPVRKSKQQKKNFLDAVQTYAAGLGYASTVEEGAFGTRNLVMGDPEKAAFLVTAHYDTPAASLIPNAVAPNSWVRFYGKVIGIMFFCALIGFSGGYLMGKGYWVSGILLLSLSVLLMPLLRMGCANKNNANDNTSGVVTVLEIMRTLLPSYRDKVCFVLFDLEEAGLVGSRQYRKVHKAATEHQLVLNLDCVGDGDEIWFFPSKKLKEDVTAMASLRRCTGWFGQKKICLRDKGFFQYASDQKNFPISVGIGAFHNKKGAGPYLTRIHTKQDTILEETNVNILRACISTLISAQ